MHRKLSYFLCLILPMYASAGANDAPLDLKEIIKTKPDIAAINREDLTTFVRRSFAQFPKNEVEALLAQLKSKNITKLPQVNAVGNAFVIRRDHSKGSVKISFPNEDQISIKGQRITWNEQWRLNEMISAITETFKTESTSEFSFFSSVAIADDWNFSIPDFGLSSRIAGIWSYRMMEKSIADTIVQHLEADLTCSLEKRNYVAPTVEQAKKFINSVAKYKCVGVPTFLNMSRRAALGKVSSIYQNLLGSEHVCKGKSEDVTCAKFDAFKSCLENFFNIAANQFGDDFKDHGKPWKVKETKSWIDCSWVVPEVIDGAAPSGGR